MKEPYPSQKHHILTKLKMARSRQGWRRLKILLILLLAKIRSRGSSRQTFGVTELGSPIISTSRSLTSIAGTNVLGVRTDAGTQYPCFFLYWCLSFYFFLLLSTARSILALFLPPLLLLLLFFHLLPLLLLFLSLHLLHLLLRKVLLSIWALLGQSLEGLRRPV